MNGIPQAHPRFLARQTAKRHLAAIWAALAGLRPGMVALDIGCGPGILSAEYAALIGPTGTVYALDPRVALHKPLPNLIALAQDAAAPIILPAPPDIVFLTDTLHHAENPAAMLRAVRAACTPTTTILIAEYDPEQPGRVGAKPPRRMAQPALLALLADTGFRAAPPQAAPDEHYAILATIS